MIIKKVIFIFFLLIFTLPVFSQEIEFETGTFAEAITKAKKEGKLVFMDAFTVWCGPCKLMEKRTFNTEAVAKYYNEHFVNIRVDMEKGDGPMLAKKYKVRGYPSFLFIDGDENLVHSGIGFIESKAFVALGEKANDPSRRMIAMQRRYNEGDRNPEFLKEYLETTFDAYDDVYLKVLEEYFATQRDWSNNENMELIFKYANNPDSKLFDELLNNRGAYEKMFEKVNVDKKIEQVFYSKINNRDNPMKPEDAENLFKKFFPDGWQEMMFKYRMQYTRNRGDREGYAKAAVEYNETIDIKDDLILNDMAWTFYEVIDDKELLKKAIKWSKKSIKISNNYYNKDTLAALYSKVGKKRKAKCAAKKAIKLAKKEGEDYTATQELLDKLSE